MQISKAPPNFKHFLSLASFSFSFLLFWKRGSISFCPQPEATARVPLLNLYLSLILNIWPHARRHDHCTCHYDHRTRHHDYCARHHDHDCHIQDYLRAIIGQHLVWCPIVNIEYCSELWLWSHLHSFNIITIVTFDISIIIYTMIILVCVRTRAAAVVAGGLISATWCELRRGGGNIQLASNSSFFNHHHSR